MQWRSAHGHILFLCARILSSIKIMVLQIAQYTKFCSEIRIVSETPVLSHSFERAALVVEFGNFWLSQLIILLLKTRINRR